MSTLCDLIDCSKPDLLVHHQLLKFTQTHAHWVGDAIQPFHPLLSPSPPAFNLSHHQGLFQWVSSLSGGQKYWSFSLSIIPSNEYSELMSFRNDFFDLLVVQGTLNSLLQCHSLKVSVLQWSDVFMVILSHHYMTTRKAIALILWTFVIRVMSLPFNTPSKSVIAFHPRRKHIF